MLYRIVIALLIIAVAMLFVFPAATQAADNYGNIMENDALNKPVIYADVSTGAAVVCRPNVTTGSGIASSSKELYQMICEGSEDVITLGNDIYWDLNADMMVEFPVTVKMNDYSIFIEDKSRLGVYGPIRFEGSGSKQPLFCVEGDFSATGALIAATEDEGTAVSISGKAASFNLELSTVISYGEDSVALELSGRARYDMNAVCVSAEKRGSVAVRSDGPVKFTLSVVMGGHASVVAPAVTADGSRLYPLPSSCSTINRYAIPNNRIEQNGICLPAGADLSKLNAVVSQYEKVTSFEMRDKDWVESPILFSLSSVVENLPDSLQEPGRYELLCRPEAPEWFPVELNEFVIPLNVVGENTPFIMDAFDAGNGVFLRFFNPIIGADEIILEYSVDDSESWRDSAELSNVSITANSANIGELQVNHSYRFRIVVKGGPMEGVSNALTYLYFTGMGNNNGGGDRDNGDRGDQGPDLPDFNDRPPQGSNDSGKADGAQLENEVPSEELPTVKSPDETAEDEIASVSQVPLISTHQDDIGNGILGWVCYAETCEDQDGTKYEEDTYDSDNENNEINADKSIDGMVYTLYLRDDELRDYISVSGSLTIIEDGIKVIIPAGQIQDIWLAEGCSFRVLIEKVDDGCFEVRFWADGEEVICHDFTAYVLYEDFAETDGYEGYYCRNISDASREDRIFQAEGREQESLIFELPEGGRYIIGSNRVTNDAVAEDMSLKTDSDGGQSDHRGMIAGGTLLIAAAIYVVFFCLRKKGGAM